MSREHITPKATGWAYGLTEPAVVEVEDALKTLQWMWDYCDDIKRNHRSFGGNAMVMKQWSQALTVVEKMAAKYLDRQAPAVAHGLVSASVHETIGKLLAEAMNSAVANGANSISMPDEYVQLAVWLSNARGQCCERAAGPGRVCDECASVSAAYSQDMAPIRSAPIWKVISPAGEVFTGESPFRAASVANKHWVKTDPEAAKRFAAALESIRAENEAENARLTAEHGTLDCPACGGSGHVGDIQTAASDVLAERHRQISVKGWTADHDDEHDTEEMAFAAACYATADEGDAPPAVWPWDWQWWKPKDRRRNLVRAGALILAELERLDRAASQPPVQHKEQS